MIGARAESPSDGAVDEPSRKQKESFHEEEPSHPMETGDHHNVGLSGYKEDLQEESWVDGELQEQSIYGSASFESWDDDPTLESEDVTGTAHPSTPEFPNGNVE
ncbi:hypothetical protein BGZ65_002302 [Modicella reniformis]|uniref:Uncharacterized protein n=1 Tax=Modicella reniformis TaxID=1440133 RepID=A0A9P6MJ98_9FUNG|nr:hypothetical protein BGZ65_002302 [Modicella reniformis]